MLAGHYLTAGVGAVLGVLCAAFATNLHRDRAEAAAAVRDEQPPRHRLLPRGGATASAAATPPEPTSTVGAPGLSLLSAAEVVTPNTSFVARGENYSGNSIEIA